MSTYLNPWRALKEFGVKGTFWKMWHMRTLKFGRLVGVDKYGNKYYENKEDYPSGAWVLATPLRCNYVPRKYLLY